MTEKEASNIVLVTGATGKHGGTGAYVVHKLRENGHLVRVLARRKSTMTEQLEKLGAEIVLGDLHDRASLVSAFNGVSQATFTYPMER
ncbi:NmrA-like family protein [Paenibacillus sp. yr247]|uniref:SDR family oxidoreductase n=1 Tax=Paenibacillus sp. yr247 TaxID=1761880 RepID=UPI0008890A1D|nr:NmrA family NAD(P)-binding protein [Paenibacillus sp. yr247]SDN52506.1 NmrA-like family protein [Paenibacillus sp. yr247]